MIAVIKYNNASVNHSD